MSTSSSPTSREKKLLDKLSYMGDQIKRLRIENKGLYQVLLQQRKELEKYGRIIQNQRAALYAAGSANNTFSHGHVSTMKRFRSIVRHLEEHCNCVDHTPPSLTGTTKDGN